MKDLLVGSTGFVGGNLLLSHNFTFKCHSSNVAEYYGTNPDLCVYAGVPSAMFLANENSLADLEIMKQARDNILKINPKKLVLISTIAVYKNSKGMNEESLLDEEGLSPYGKNRLQLEKWVRQDYPDALIIRLPALYGKGLKKNFIYDFHSIVPSMLTANKYQELSNKSNLIEENYSINKNGFYRLNENADIIKLKEFYINNDFNALYFTDSRSCYQFYNLSRLWDDIVVALKHDINLLNLCTPPIKVDELYMYLTGKRFSNILSREPYNYDLHSNYAHIYNGINQYLCTKEEELADIRKFLDGWDD